jgi:hypothetical protein
MVMHRLRIRVWRPKTKRHRIEIFESDMMDDFTLGYFDNQFADDARSFGVSMLVGGHGIGCQFFGVS